MAGGDARRSASELSGEFNNDPEVFRARRPETWARRNLDKIRPGYARAAELRIPHGYQEFDGIAHNLGLPAQHVKDENFAFAAKSFSLHAPLK